MREDRHLQHGGGGGGHQAQVRPTGPERKDEIIKTFNSQGVQVIILDIVSMNEDKSLYKLQHPYPET